MENNFKELSNETKEKLKVVQLEILDEIDRICKKNKINYFLCGGTLLGAIRHKGFIPWDDDIDIMMIREDYEKFINVCKKSLNSKYYLDCPENNDDFIYIFTKIRKNNTTFNEKAIADRKMHKGIYVDIFPLDVAGDNFKITFIKGFFVKALMETLFLKRKLYDIKQCRHPLFVRFFSLLSCKNIYRLQKSISISYKGKNKSHLVSYYGVYSLRKECYDYDTIFPAKLVEFEGKMYPGLNDNHKYLTSMYGDYMQLPPEDKRVNHSALYVDFNNGECKKNK